MQFIKYLVTGVFNTIFGVSIFAILIYANFKPENALLTTTILGMFFNFKTIGIFVFDNNNNKLIFKFAMLYMMMYFTAVYIFKFINLSIQNNYITGIISILLCSIIGFFANRHFIFKSKID